MGSGIARNLLGAGFPLAVYNRTKDKIAPLLSAGAQPADSPAEAAAMADAVISIVGDDAASQAVWLGERGALAGLRAGALAIECSTLSVAWVREWHGLALARSGRPVDAPLAGSKLAAQSGTLTLFVGATPEALEAARPVLSAFSNNILHFGPPGSGMFYKLINNMMGAVHMAALSEGVAMAERAGLNMEMVAQAISSGATSSPVVRGKAPKVIARDHTDVHFALRWMHKDLTYALRAADEVGAALPTVAGVRELVRLAMQRGLSDLDYAAVSEVVRGK